jgi:superfamily II DNA or RNA helicase
MALALEEMGFSHFGSTNGTKSLFAIRNPPIQPIDSIQYKVASEVVGKKFRKANYVMITGDTHFSHNNADDLAVVNGEDNKYGEKVKVILISRAGAEGLDYKNIRQVHIMEPWYNMNRIEQIIGRAVRNLSHCKLPFEERNVEIYMHASMIKDSEKECADLYIYRIAERKAIQIGKVTRLLKESSVDCLLNIKQSNFTVEKLNAFAANKNIIIKLSSFDKEIEYKIGDRPFTDTCDYMDKCEMVCSHCR